MFLFRATHGKVLAGSSSFASQTTTAAGRHVVSNPIRPSERYESTATSATSLNQARRVRSSSCVTSHSESTFGLWTRCARPVDLGGDHGGRPLATSAHNWCSQQCY